MEMTISQARQFLQNSGAQVRMTGGGLIDDPQPQIEARADKAKQWSYVASIAEGEVNADNVYWWVEQNMAHSSSEWD